MLNVLKISAHKKINSISHPVSFICVGEGVPICGGFDKKKMQIGAGSPAGSLAALALGTRRQRALKVNVPFSAGHYRMGQQRERIQQQHVNWPEFSGAEDAPG